MKISAALMICCSVFCVSAANASEFTKSLGDCLVKSTTGQDRIDLVRWIVLAYSKHPEVASFASTEPGIDDQIQETTGAIFTKLLTVSCRTEAKKAFENDGQESLRIAFEVLGQVAALELTRDQAVNEAISGFLPYIDEEQIQEIFD